MGLTILNPWTLLVPNVGMAATIAASITQCVTSLNPTILISPILSLYSIPHIPHPVPHTSFPLTPRSSDRFIFVIVSFWISPSRSMNERVDPNANDGTIRLAAHWISPRSGCKQQVIKGWSNHSRRPCEREVRFPFPLHQWSYRVRCLNLSSFNNTNYCAHFQGYRGLFDGITGTWLRQMTYSVCRFWAYDESKKLVGAGPGAPAWKLSLAGGMGMWLLHRIN